MHVNLQGTRKYINADDTYVVLLNEAPKYMLVTSYDPTNKLTRPTA